ncbi:unnamed protein product [Paramecium primaurelia]|uniref:UVR domain-containing protein n=1 Tax=Paramecium primaurelia TaxID=5886 RepID=A0A8S1PUR6_PARPR|nr:unnamed protein product [Paramecium primaurelia]
MNRIDFNWVPFHIVACSSEDFNSPADFLSTQQYGQQRSWECSRTADYPVEIILRFHTRIQVDHLLIASKADKGIPKMNIYIGDGLNGGWNDAEYRRAGQCENIYVKPLQVKLTGIGNYLKIKIIEHPKRAPQNPYGQVSISLLKIWGIPRSYNIVDQSEEVYGAKDNIDKMLIDLGIPVDMINWFEDDDRNYQYAPIDDESRDTLNDLKLKRDSARRVEDFEFLKELKRDMKLIFEIGKEIWKLKRELSFCVAKEDYLRAMELRNRLKRLEAKRDTFDALYETSRYEKMINLQRPTTAEYMRHLEYLEMQEQMNADALRRQRELEEQNRRRMIQEEQNLLGKSTDNKIDKTPWWEKGGDDRNIKKKKKKEKKEDDEPLLNFNNPFAFNEGDVDLELYLNPLLAQAGEKMVDIPLEILRRLHQLGYLTVFGAKAWTGIHSDSWRIREACAQAVLNFLEMPLPDKYKNGKTKKLFLAAMEFAKICMEDKILSIYFIGLKILSTALAPPVCGTDVSPAIINKVLKEFTPILIEKISELNFRARDISLHTLLSIYRHPAANLGMLVSCCFDKMVMDPNFPTLFVPPDKQPTRIIQARLEIVSNVLQEFGYDQRQFNHQDIFFILATPCLFHQANEIRLLSIEVIAALYQFVGVEIRTMVDAIENLKPGLKDQIMARLDEIDQQAPGSKQVDRGLSLVPEEEQEENQSALLKKQKDNANTQKQDLDKTINNVSQNKNQDKLNNSQLSKK